MITIAALNDEYDRGAMAFPFKADQFLEMLCCTLADGVRKSGGTVER